MRPRLPILIFAAAVLALAGIAHAEPRESVHFGLLNIEQEATYGDRRDNVQERTIDYLREACPGIDFSVEVYDILGLQAAVREGRVDAFLSSSGFFVELWHQGVKDLATLVSNDFPDPNRCVGGSFIVRAEEPQDLTLDDLHGRSAAAPNPQNFMAYQIGMAEIARRGYDPGRFFSRLDFTGNDLPEVLRRVASGDADVGLVRACILESLLKKMPELRGRLKVVEPVKDAPISCAVSTPLYPGWTVAATTSLHPASAEAISRALLTQPPSGAGGYRWSVATDFKSVNDVFRLLKTGPYAYLDEWTLKGFFLHYWPWFALALTALFFWVLHWLSVEKLVKKRTAELQAALGREALLHRKALGAAEQSEKLLQLGVVNELSCIYAHEMAQPLTSIGYLARTLKTLSGKETLNRDLIRRCSEKIAEDLSLAEAILTRVRRYAKSPIRRNSEVDLSGLLNEVYDSVRRLNPGTELVLDALPAVVVRGDQLELSILILNLLKNAASAALDHRVSASLKADGDDAVIEVKNLGKSIRGSPFADRVLIRKAQSSFSEAPQTGSPGEPRPDGLGLGLLIVQSIVHAHGGVFSWESGKCGASEKAAGGEPGKAHEGSEGASVIVMRVSLPLNGPETNSSAGQSTSNHP